MIISRNDRYFKGGFSGLMIAAAIFCGAFAARADGQVVTPVPGYDILEYLESSGTQYIDTGVVYANDTKLTQRFCIVDFAGHMSWSPYVDCKCKMRLYSCQIYDGASLVRDLGSPCPGGLQDADRCGLPLLWPCGESRRSWPRNLRQVDE